MNTGHICVDQLLHIEKLQLPTASSASSMRRSQSAVEATADYLGTRVAGLSYLNQDEANWNIFIYRAPKGER